MTTPIDITIANLVTLRLVDAGPKDRAAVERQFGAGEPSTGGPADITVRYRADVADRDQLIRYLGPGTAGYTEDGFVLLRGRFRRPVRVMFPGDEIGGPCELLCEHGVGRVPHLVALVNLAILSRGGVALHASTFERDGIATMATGWSKGGKTEALLAACTTGAGYVSDEWTHISADRHASGTSEPVRVWDWQLEQLPWLQKRMSRSDRYRLSMFRLAERAATTVHATPRVTTAIGRNRFVDVAPESIARNSRRQDGVPLGLVLLMTATDSQRTTSAQISGRDVADRMASSLTYERTPLAETMAAYRFAFPKASTQAFDQVDDLERERLRTLLDPLRAVEILHPYPVGLATLGAEIARAEEDA